ncbi:hypothetical protein BOO69_14195 [Sulfitobacter alexandrii]|uniref:Glycosyltransferase n=1 Tax=Sulfitobacter alexandrii TaxID=1917485 RepID=A0A1J0WJD5_9RHOB|nr:hypothetical protein BOO69_14195 [Sulfitobacter alexandrii]
MHVRVAEQRVPAGAILQQVMKARQVAKRPDSVAIACWESSHNPIGRAHVLYNVIAKHRPAFLFSFNFSEFGTKLWAPLENENFDRIVIPWDDRHQYFSLFQMVGLHFPTIWLSKPRLPTFELAARISGKTTKLILDHDDNDHHFSKQTKADRYYGPNSVPLASYLQTGITAHTAASATLAAECDAEVVRHARAAYQYVTPPPADPEAIKIGFIGTVRPHKGLIEAARAIRVSSWNLQIPLKFHVYGDFSPASLKDELTELGVVVQDNVKTADLFGLLSTFDLVLTGFPTQGVKDESITRYQISSKIGDALAVGRPALVPYSQSVEDLDNINGVFIFHSSTFSAAIKNAMTLKTEIGLPHQFSFDGAYEAFHAAEAKATTPPISFRLLGKDTSEQALAVQNTLVLLWKQNDAGIYGRRVDQIARSYKSLFPSFRVIVLEFCHRATYDAIANQTFEFSGDAKIVSPAIDRKIARSYRDAYGVDYHTILHSTADSLNNDFISYLIEQRISPTHSTLILFPVIRFLEQVYDIISQFHCIIDIVDNQFPWSTETSKKYVGSQYFSLTSMAETLVFNSQFNVDFFKDYGMITDQDIESGRVSVISNWYSGAEVQPPEAGIGCETGFNIIYSGNMNDRIDWGLLESITLISNDITLHLVGAARRRIDALGRLTARRNVVYWGPMQESQVLNLLRSCDLAIVPHVSDEVSSYMNPLKVHMYRAMGVPVISTDVLGLTADEGLSIFPDHAGFLDAVKLAWEQHCLSGKVSRIDLPKDDENPSKHAYMKILIQSFAGREDKKRPQNDQVPGGVRELLLPLG